MSAVGDDSWLSGNDFKHLGVIENLIFQAEEGGGGGWLQSSFIPRLYLRRGYN